MINCNRNEFLRGVFYALAKYKQKLLEIQSNLGPFLEPFDPTFIQSNKEQCRQSQMRESKL